MARRQTLVQLDDSRISALDQRAVIEGKTRSQLIREAVDLLLATGESAEIDRQIVEGYTRFPPDEDDPWADLALDELIREEPW